MADFLSDCNSNVCSLAVYEIFANLMKCQNIDRENGQGQSGEKRAIFSGTLATWVHTHTARDSVDDYRQNLQIRFT